MANSEQSTTDNQIFLGKLQDSLYGTSRSVGATDTLLVGATYMFNLLMLALLFMAQKNNSIYAVFIISLIIVNILIIFTFRNSKEMREKLHNREKQLYEDLNIDKYFDDSILQNYKQRYNIWTLLDIVLGIMVLTVAILLKI